MPKMALFRAVGRDNGISLTKASNSLLGSTPRLPAYLAVRTYFFEWTLPAAGGPATVGSRVFFIR